MRNGHLAGQQGQKTDQDPPGEVTPPRHPYPAQDCPVEWVERGFRPCLARGSLFPSAFQCLRLENGDYVASSTSGHYRECPVRVHLCPARVYSCPVCVYSCPARVYLPSLVFTQNSYLRPQLTARGDRSAGLRGEPSRMGLVPFLKRPHRAPLPPPPREDTGEQGHQKWALARRGILDCPGSRAGRNTFLLGR